MQYPRVAAVALEKNDVVHPRGSYRACSTSSASAGVDYSFAERATGHEARCSSG